MYKIQRHVQNVNTHKEKGFNQGWSYHQKLFHKYLFDKKRNGCIGMVEKMKISVWQDQVLNN